MFLISSSVQFNELIFAVILINSFDQRSAHGKVIKNIGIPSCITIAKTSKFFFQYAGAPLIEDIKL